MRDSAERGRAEELIRSGMNDCAVARATGIPRGTIRDWRWAREGRPRYQRKGPARPSNCPICDGVPLDHREYAYLLGLYLGDGCLSALRRDVYFFRVSLDARYSGIIDECTRAMAIVGSRRIVGRVRAPGCIVVYSLWKHWVCLFPQHGPGKKHRRTIALAPWQQEIASTHPDRLLRGLIHSDGSRTLNRVNGKIYPRYEFTNYSEGIRRIFCRACDSYGVSWTQPKWKGISIAWRRDVARLDLVIGPKS